MYFIIPVVGVVGCSIHFMWNTSIDALKKITKEWDKITQLVICVSCTAFSKRLQQVVDADIYTVQLVNLNIYIYIY